MRHQDLVSTSIRSTAHDPITDTGEIAFHSGRKYRVHGFTAADHDALRNAESSGRHFNTVIKGNFRLEPIDGDTSTDKA